MCFLTFSIPHDDEENDMNEKELIGDDRKKFLKNFASITFCNLLNSRFS